ncbi:MAG: tRNA (guanosine(46)-N7)-methyltransferase TrmB [Gammaproteobacteria bacterium]|nr:tRNA (guanosine(46)-N7)-methyltransferase TrmB [Gammaproteobacteria bacterium]
MRDPLPTQVTGAARRRPTRSYVRREGRLTPAQKRALEHYLPDYEFPESEAAVDLAAIFGRRAPTTLEIGFGNGDALADLAAAHPERNYIGVEVHRPGVGHLLLRLQRAGLENVRVANRDGTQVLRNEIPDDSLDEILVYFPDPWPKKRHHKRRLIQTEFALMVSAKLAVGGRLELATDWSEYAEQMHGILRGTPGLVSLGEEGGYAKRPLWRPETKYEIRGRRQGHEIFDLTYRRAA